MKIYIGIELDDLSDEQMLALTQVLRGNPKISKKMAKAISEATIALNGTIDDKTRISNSERARKAAHARWAKRNVQKVDDIKQGIPQEISSLIQIAGDDNDTLDGRDIMEGNYPGGPGYAQEIPTEEIEHERNEAYDFSRNPI